MASYGFKPPWRELPATSLKTPVMPICASDFKEVNAIIITVAEIILIEFPNKRKLLITAEFLYKF